MIFFQINGRTITSPTDINYSYEELDKVERTIDGTMVIDEIGKKKKIEVSWNYLTKEDMTILNTEASASGFVTINYRNNTDGNITSMTAKAQDFSYSPGYDWVHDKVIWRSVSVSFVER
jgi:hypothetical protein